MIYGSVHDPNFSELATTLERQLHNTKGAGSALCVYFKGECVIDIWGGVVDSSNEPWTENTLVCCFGAGNGVLATLVHKIVEQTEASYDDPIANDWQEFGRNGKARITLRQVLSHEAGLHSIADLIDSPREMLDWDHMKTAVTDAASSAPASAATSAYHALTLGWILGGWLEARTQSDLTSILHEHLVAPLALDGAFFGLPETETQRTATLKDGITRGSQRDPDALLTKIRSSTMDLLRFASLDFELFHKAIHPFQEEFDWNSEESRATTIPSANGYFTARSLARVYAMLAGSGQVDGTQYLSPQSVEDLSIIQNRSRDTVLLVPMHWRLGYHRVFTTALKANLDFDFADARPFRKLLNLGVSATNAFGHFGFGGSGGFCDTERNLSMGLTVNSGSGTPVGDYRITSLASKTLQIADRLNVA